MFFLLANKYTYGIIYKGSKKGYGEYMRIVAYCRVSTENEHQLESLQNQKDFFDDFAKRYNHELIRIYADEGISGKQMDNRVQFMRMLDDSQHNLFDMVVVKDISRFARNTVDFLTAVRELKERGIEVQFLSNNQTILGNSEFILTIFSAMAQEESANLSKRVKFGKKVNASKGRVPNIIYGYDKIDTFNLIINTDEANVVRRIFNMYCDDGYGSRKISNTLNETNTSSKKGTRWTPKTIRRIITNPIYIGTLINNKIETVDFLTGKRQAVSEGESFTHERPELRIISDEQFENAQKQMAERQKIYENKNPGGRYSNRHIFSTLIKCANCGYSFSRKTQTYKNTYYRWRCSGNNLFTKDFCPNNFVIDELELLEHIKEYLSGIIADRHNFISNVIKEYNAKYKSANDGIDQKSLLKQAEKLNRIKGKYKSMYANDIISIDELKEKCAELDGQISEIEKSISDSEYFTLKGDKLEEKLQQAINDIENLLSLDEYTNADMRKIIDKIIVHQNGEIYIHLKVLSDII